MRSVATKARVVGRDVITTTNVTARMEYDNGAFVLVSPKKKDTVHKFRKIVWNRKTHQVFEFEYDV